jgi:Ni/Fe-hydrogenase subunit HybB-like protein
MLPQAGAAVSPTYKSQKHGALPPVTPEKASLPGWYRGVFYARFWLPSVNKMKKHWIIIASALVLVGFVSFLIQLSGSHPERAWQAYLINFLLWSAMAQGGLLFSAVMHITNARWSQPLQGLSESFAAFFPISLVLFLLLFLGSDHIFPWVDHDLHGKETWLNVPFLFSRDVIALLVLYGLGLGYLYYALRLRQEQIQPKGRIRSLLLERWSKDERDAEWCRSRMSLFSVLYIAAYALVLTLIAFDLVMSMEPHWVSTLFGPYHFVKAFYVGLAALIILASLFRFSQGEASGLSASHFHDLGKLFFAFCLLWADFFYCQLLVIWYGNISEETSYIIKRTMVQPWNTLAWTVFVVCFIIPFVILLSQKIKTKPIIMTLLCSAVLVGIWLEHLLLLGPALNHDVTSLPLGFGDGLISLGFLGLMAMAVAGFLNLFPRAALVEVKGVNR